MEHVTVIPKCSNPETFGDLRNISCTNFVSKVLESYVLEWAQEEVTIKFTQFGGVRGCSGLHLIIKVWQKILENLEDRRAATFNRLSFQHCLTSFKRLGASTQVLRLLAAFLSGQQMRVRVGHTWSRAREVPGGVRVPQRSILGVFLFNVTTDDLEKGSDYVSGGPQASRQG